MLVNLSKEEAEDIYWSISCRLGLIETGDPSYRAKDIAAGAPGKLRPLSTDQMRIIIRMEELMTKMMDVKR